MMRLSAVALWTRGRLHGADVEVTGFSIDTRTLKAGDLFVALPGERVDAHDFVAAAAAKGAVAALVTRPVDAPIPQVIVDDTQAALGDLASAARARGNVRVVGITGSNGKTTVKTLTASILSRHGRTHVNAGNFNNEIGMPLTLLAMPEDTEYAVLEMGAGKPGDIDYLAAIARPDIGLVNSIAPAHLERMGTIEGVAETKGALYRSLPADGVAIINADDERFAGFFTNLAGSRSVLRYALDHRADIGADIVEERIDGTHFVLSTPHGDGDVHLPLPGRHNVANALAAAAIATALNVPVEKIVEGLEQVPPVAGRLNLEPMPGGWTLIDDSYNANPGSAAAAIDTLALALGERWLVLGDMAELGPEAVKLHAGIGELAHRRGIERLLATGAKSAAAVEAFGPGAQHFATQEALIEAACAQIHEGVTCLVKGSRSSGMDRVVAALKKYAEGASDAA
ncbi:MAG: UDP-N-acetylmuramoyl-tripeptide--D-alanyl-D-alanine ligase [Luteibacter sp.]|uniref:UDP-N-acetylmuramoyl-tripeptide--D-alanyl-D- alanine ligase n=1 Tax=Luteibacter sp. TaxID=1886636 RepID=UPI002807DA04|nr:UDP-N-acetylmuramoyl-tripeptide--D-alanyl-D-alanine ligase [Luteibacter sp.]MDQ7998161.1 UDP-N-acetylmuramoyl-tripeptide--D-alanyl-D-alanine ligase [Luteibacter sp.]MDQ8048291.1 UDP-N-acetylmuramoyl-tripeptide--D-alanyl-D-alanine ligase [Luteibacter sp.]